MRQLWLYTSVPVRAADKIRFVFVPVVSGWFDSGEQHWSLIQIGFDIHVYIVD